MNDKDKKVTSDERIIQRFCAEYNLELKKIDSYVWDQSGYIINSDGRIEILNLYGLKIKNIPEYIAELSELKILHLVRNELTSIKEINKLSKLETLVIQANEITNIYIEDIAPLKHLKSIDLSMNPITDLQPLLHFNMRFTLNDKYIASENEILINNCNHIQNPPIEIVKQGDETIRRYFDKIQQVGLDYIYEAKLILVGEGGAGKTSLLRRLLNENADLPESDKRTRGIEVVDFEFEKGKVAHIWDFGGQVVYYPVHRFFITENSVFVLLASTRQNSRNFDYWIPTIYQFGGDSPIIIGQTCHDGNTVRWNDLDTYLGNTNFNIVRTLDSPYYQIDLPNNNKGLNTIKQCIISQIKKLHHFGKPIPKSWSAVRYALLEKSKLNSYISFQSFTDLCKELEPDSFKNKEDIEDCCNFLHNIGVILWYSKTEALKSCVILKPEWAMSAVYQIIDDSDIQNNNGHICPDDFSRLWNGKSNEEHTILKKMLRTFNIAFPTKHSQGQYIIPARLTSMPLEKKWVSEKESLHCEYTFEFMPKGIVNQLSAELSSYIQDNEVWNNAVNLTLNNSKSQVIENAYFRKLTITSKGIDARSINVLIMNALKNIITSYKGIKEEINVKCTCKYCQESETPTTFSYNQLVERLSKKKNITVTCNNSGDILNISKLLYNVGLGEKGIHQPPEKIDGVFNISKLSYDVELGKKKIYQPPEKIDEVFSISESPYNVKLSKKKTQQSFKKIFIFLASSEELKRDREEFERFINRENKELTNEGIFIDLVIWEDFIDRMSRTRLQDEYNKAVVSSDIFVSLFWTKVGKYTKEEFSKAYAHFKEKGKPSLYTYFLDADINPNIDNSTRVKFVKKLKELGHYPTSYKNIDDLKYQFKMQLQKILPNLT